MTGLYVHIPFCLQKCAYCDFYSVAGDEGLSDDYVNALCREIGARTDGLTLDTIYVGGGTPTTLRNDQLMTIMGVLRDGCDISAKVEFTVEANPGTLTRDKAELLASFGVNRISIGIQSLHDDDLRLLGRSHRVTDALDAFIIARDAGFANISVDLIYGIPRQTPEGWRKVLDGTLELGPQHLSAYELTPERDTPLHAAVEAGTIIMPDDDLVAEMNETLAEVAERRGYEHYEISNFALPGFRCRHNMGYWHRKDYVGVGAGAHSCVGNIRTSNVRDTRIYAKGILEGKPVIDECRELIPDEVLREYIFLGLRKAEGIDLSPLPAEKRAEMKKAAEELRGLVVLEGEIFRLTRRGFLLSNEIIARVM